MGRGDHLGRVTDSVRSYAARASFSTVEVRPIDHPFCQFQRLGAWRLSVPPNPGAGCPGMARAAAYSGGSFSSLPDRPREI